MAKTVYNVTKIQVITRKTNKQKNFMHNVGLNDKWAWKTMGLVLWNVYDHSKRSPRKHNIAMINIEIPIGSLHFGAQALKTQ